MAWSPQQELVTLEEAKDRIKLSQDIDTEDAALQLQLLIAHAAVMDFVRQRISGQAEWQAEIDTWDADTTNPLVRGAILEQFAYQYRFRSDDEESQKQSGDEAVCPRAQSLLKRLRDPAIG